MGSIRQVQFVLGRHRRRKWILLIVLALMLSGLEVAAAALVFLLIGQVAEPTGPVELPFVGDPARLLPWFSDTQIVFVLTAGIGTFFIARAAFLVFQKYAQSRVVNNATAEISARLVKGYLKMPYALHLRRNSAELVRNAFFNVQTLTKLLESGVKLMAESLIILGLLAAMILLAPVATIVATLVLGPLTFLVLRIVKARTRAYGEAIKEAEKEGLTVVQEGLAGIRDLRILGAEEFFAKAYRTTRTSQARSRMRYAAVGEAPRALIETLLVLLIAGFFAFVTASPGMTTATLSILGLFAYVGVRMKPSIQAVISGVNNIRHYAPALDDVASDLLAIKHQSREASPGPAVPRLEKEIKLEGVDFAYEGADTPALVDIDLTIPRGTALGIVGPTGGGKSTLVDVISGLLPPSRGTVSVDGVDIHASDIRTWYDQLGVVSQAVFILDATVRQNVALGVPTHQVDEAALLEAVHLAQLEPVVRELPEGLDTRLGERGVRLSGGQRQRVAIARALYRRSDVLIFDEGTAALDNTTEAELVAALEGLRGRKTLILVAHRLSTVRHCDHVIVIESGRIEDAGTFEQLAGRHPMFAALRTGSVSAQPSVEQASQPGRVGG